MYHGLRFFFQTQTLIHGSSSMGLSSWCWLLPWAETSALFSSTERNTGLCGCTGECRPMGGDADATEWILPLTITSRDWLSCEVIYRTKQAERLWDNWNTMKSASYESTEKLLPYVRNVEKKRGHICTLKTLIDLHVIGKMKHKNPKNQAFFHHCTTYVLTIKNDNHLKSLFWVTDLWWTGVL